MEITCFVQLPYTLCSSDPDFFMALAQNDISIFDFNRGKDKAVKRLVFCSFRSLVNKDSLSLKKQENGIIHESLKLTLRKTEDAQELKI